MSQRGWLPVSTVWSSLLPAQRKLARGPMPSPVRVISLHSPLSVCLSVCPSSHLSSLAKSVCLSLLPAISLFIRPCLSISLSLCPSSHLSPLSLSVCLSVCLFMSAQRKLARGLMPSPVRVISLHSPLSVCLSVCLSFQPSLIIGPVCLSVCTSVLSARRKLAREPMPSPIRVLPLHCPLSVRLSDCLSVGLFICTSSPTKTG